MKTTRTAAEQHDARIALIEARDAAHRAEDAALAAGDNDAFWAARHAKTRAQAGLDQQAWR
jgi:hypothetical protein